MTTMNATTFDEQNTFTELTLALYSPKHRKFDVADMCLAYGNPMQTPLAIEHPLFSEDPVEFMAYSDPEQISDVLVHITKNFNDDKEMDETDRMVATVETVMYKCLELRQGVHSLCRKNELWAEFQQNMDDAVAVVKQSRYYPHLAQALPDLFNVKRQKAAQAFDL